MLFFLLILLFDFMQNGATSWGALYETTAGRTRCTRFGYTGPGKHNLQGGWGSPIPYDDGVRVCIWRLEQKKNKSKNQ